MNSKTDDQPQAVVGQPTDRPHLAFGRMNGSESISAWTLISLLVGAGTKVTIVPPSDDAAEPPCAVYCAGGLFDDGEGFYGDTVLQCLDAANRTRGARGGQP